MDHFSGRPVVILGHVLIPCLPIGFTPPALVGPQSPFARQPSTSIILPSPVVPISPSRNLPPAATTHPFGASVETSKDWLEGLSVDEVDLLTASFPNYFGNSWPNPAPNFCDPFTGGASVDNAPSHYQEKLPVLFQPQPQYTPNQHGLGLTFGTNTNMLELTIFPPMAMLPSPAEPSFSVHGSADIELSGSHSSPSSEPAFGSLFPGPSTTTCSQQQLEIDTPARRPLLLAGNHANAQAEVPTERVSTPTDHSAHSFSHSSAFPGSRASTPMLPKRNTLLPLPVTPRAFGHNPRPNPLSRSTSVPLRRFPSGTPLPNSFRSFTDPSPENGWDSPLNPSTPCPSTRRFSGVPYSAPHSPALGGSVPAKAQPSRTLPASVPPSPVDDHHVPGSSGPSTTSDGWGTFNDADPPIHPPDDLGRPETPDLPVQDLPEVPEQDPGIRPSPHRVRTPPPLARAINQVLLSQEDIRDDSEGFIMTESQLSYRPIHVNLVPPLTNAAPTTAEITLNKAKEVQSLRKARKCNEKPGKAALKSGDRIGTYQKPEQAFLTVMKAHMLWDIVVRSPWPEDDAELIRRSKEFAIGTTGLPGDEYVTEKYARTVSSNYSIFTMSALIPPAGPQCST